MTSKPHFEVSRRSLLAGAAAGAVMLGADPKAWATQVGDPWSQARAIVNRLSQPVSFPSRTFSVTDYGATRCSLVSSSQIWNLVPGATSTSAPVWVQGTSRLSNPTVFQTSTQAPGSYDNYGAFTAAIKACNAAGGGTVVVPSGNWYIAGPITLLSNVNFHLNSGAVIWFDPNPANYAKYGPYNFGSNGNLVQSRWQGNDCYNFSPLIYAFGQNNIALTADDNTAVLNGQGGTPYGGSTFQCWWTWKGNAGTAGFVSGQPSEGTANALNPALVSTYIPSTAPVTVNLIEYGTSTAGTSTSYTKDPSYLQNQSEAYYPLSLRIYGIGHQVPPNMVQFHSCTNVLMLNYQITNTPCWQHNPVNCRNVVIRGVYANSVGPNNDGFDPDACSYVLIDNVTFNTGDDCIAIKAGKANDTGYGPTQNIVIQNCTMNSGHGGVTIGSEMSGGVQNVFVQNLNMLNVNYASNPLNIALRFKTNMNRGGFIRNYYARNIKLPNGINLTPGYYTPLAGSPIPKNTVSTNQGGIITFDCDYSPASDNVRIRPPVITNINISNVTASPVPGTSTSCYQAIIVQGPVATDYNGLTSAPAMSPVSGVTISNCNFGTPVNTATPYYLYNIQNSSLSNVIIAGQTYTKSISA
ncbi:glycoside hydrolase family 28 protein [Telmatospirillum sp.]|uniref:glycoside hydrolase family 28 protein n=1 Tax=Telmatospirillum sp. TaxID=2079197 RepID=UPI002846BA62|nr:glycoside hydrolase family 28 protein [Telmatospirillum sp.]MDR3436566.1 glycoside hydrolase family 28 protein [Telmatospirillum sp.]